MHKSKTFDSLYHQLAQAWEAHQKNRRSHASASELGGSSLRLNEARLAMWDWHIRNSTGIR